MIGVNQASPVIQETPAAPSLRPLTRADLPEMADIHGQMRNRRSVREGYVRGWGLEFGGLADLIRLDPLYLEAVELAAGRTLVSEARRMNLFLLLRFYLPLLGPGDIVEFGAYRAGNAAFMAHVAQATMPGTRVFALDTFTGMPATDRAIDAHSAGDFADANVDDIRGFLEASGIDNVTLVQGRFEDTASSLIEAHGPFTLAHIDCDIHSAVAFAYDAIRPAMVRGGYLVFDDATTSSCIGATEAVEELAIRRDGLSSEQIYPHFVFRAP
jgi:predicted O-methyltransferase YrrM